MKIMDQAMSLTLKAHNNSCKGIRRDLNSFASKKLSTKAVSLKSKSTPPFKMAHDSEIDSVTQVTGIQRPKPLVEYLTVPVLKNHSRPRPKLVEQKILVANDYSIDNEYLVGVEAETRVNDFECTLRQYNTK